MLEHALFKSGLAEHITIDRHCILRAMNSDIGLKKDYFCKHFYYNGTGTSLQIWNMTRVK